MMSKIIKRYLLLLAPLLIVSACAYDNYDPPKSVLSGEVVYNGKPIHVQSQQVSFRLFQTGFQRRIPITVQVAPDGSYKALLFNGNYQIIFPRGQGPFIQNTKSDTLDVKVRGNTEQNIKVLPYYMIQKPQFSVSGSTVSANFGLKQIITDNRAKDIQFVALYVGKTRFANDQRNVASQTIDGSQITDMSSIHLSAKVPKLTPTQSYVFVHIGVKIQNVEDMLLSKVEKLQLK
jgi:hypothetical protein